MSLQTEYKNEVNSISLSNDFKESLKAKCIEELKKQTSEKPAITVSENDTSKLYSRMKVYKYVSIAACLVAIISSIGVVSLISNSAIKTSSPDAVSYDLNSAANSMETEVEAVLEEEALDFDNNDDILMAELVGAPEESELVDDDTVYPALPDSDLASEEESDNLVTANPITNYAPSDYHGDFNTDDYVLDLRAGNTNSTATVYTSAARLKRDLGTTEAAVTGSSYNAMNFYDVLGSAYKDEAKYDSANLVKMTVQGIASGEDIPSPGASYTPYNVKIEYDYFNQTSVNINACVWINGTADYQVDGMPIYKEGDTILASLYPNSNGSVSVVDELLYDVYSLSGTDIAYHRGYDAINPGSTDMGILGEELEFITTTANNPVKYSHKAAVKELSRYIRRKVVSEGYEFADLEKLALVSLGEADISTLKAADEPAPEENESANEPDESEDNAGSEAEEPTSPTPIKNARVTTTDDNMVITVQDTQITLGSESYNDYLSEKYSMSISGTSTDSGKTTAMFVGGKLVFDSPLAFTGNLVEIEVTSDGCPLDISFKGAKLGDDLEIICKLFGINSVLDENCKLTYRGDTIEAVLTFKYGKLAKISIK